MIEVVLDSRKKTPSFYDARRRNKKVLSVGGRSVTLTTFSFFAHSQFEHYRRQYINCLDNVSITPLDKLNKLILLLDATYADWRDIDVVYLPNLIVAATELNVSPPELAWQTTLETDSPSAEKEASDTVTGLTYIGSNIIGVTAYLAEMFKLSPGYILDEMTLYEVNCLLQEAYLLEYKHQEWSYTIAGDVGYEKVGEDWKKTPLPAPDWMKKSKAADEGKAALLKFKQEQQKIKEQLAAKGISNKVLDRSTPTGRVVDFTKLGPGGVPTITDIAKTDGLPPMRGATLSDLLPGSEKVNE